MNEPDVTKYLEGKELDETQVKEVAGAGIDLCSPGQIAEITSGLIQSYENLVDFASHVIERVGGSNS